MSFIQVQPTWVNETLPSDEENIDQEKVAQINQVNPIEGAFNPLSVSSEMEANPLNVDSGISNPLSEERTSTANTNSETQAPVQAQEQQETMNEEEALLATATEPPPFVNECQAEETEAVMETGDLLEGNSDNPLAGVESQDTVVTETQTNEGDPFSSDQPAEEPKLEPQNQAPLSEEDLLTGPAHNLDDTQYKADYADPNLDDIFK